MRVYLRCISYIFGNFSADIRRRITPLELFDFFFLNKGLLSQANFKSKLRFLKFYDSRFH